MSPVTGVHSLPVDSIDYVVNSVSVLAAPPPSVSSPLLFDSGGHHSPAAESPFVYVGQNLAFAPSGTHPLLVGIVELLYELNVFVSPHVTPSAIGRPSATGATVPTIVRLAIRTCLLQCGARRHVIIAFLKRYRYIYIYTLAQTRDPRCEISCLASRSAIIAAAVLCRHRSAEFRYV